MDVSARVLLRLSPHASLYPSHLPYLFLRQMRYLPWKHKMLKMSTREQCQITDSFIQGDPALVVGKVLPLRFSNKQSYQGSGSRDSENDVSSIFEKVIMLGLALEIRRAVPLRFWSKQSCWECFLECE
ncbi:hypothetical protein ACFX2H_017893 [Malus domestica]